MIHILEISFCRSVTLICIVKKISSAVGAVKIVEVCGLSYEEI